jgi:hypothetical protein
MTLFDIVQAKQEIATYRRVRAHGARLRREIGSGRRGDTGAMFPMLLSICAERGIEWPEIMSETRGQKHIAYARQDFMKKAHVAGFSMPQIGTFLGRDHTTVLHGIRASEKRREMGL